MECDTNAFYNKECRCIETILYILLSILYLQRFFLSRVLFIQGTHVNHMWSVIITLQSRIFYSRTIYHRCQLKWYLLKLYLSNTGTVFVQKLTDNLCTVFVLCLRWCPSWVEMRSLTLSQSITDLNLILGQRQCKDCQAIST